MIGDMESHWSRLEHAHKAFLAALGDFLRGDKSERLELLKSGYRTNRALVIAVLEYANPEDLKDLLPFLVEHARSVHGHLQKIRRLICSLPKEWLIEHIEPVVEPILLDGDDQDYRRLLELYFEIDRGITGKLAERAVLSTDPDIRDAGQDFLEKLR